MKTERTITATTTITLTGWDVIELLNAGRGPEDQIPVSASVECGHHVTDDERLLVITYSSTTTKPERTE